MRKHWRTRAGKRTYHLPKMCDLVMRTKNITTRQRGILRTKALRDTPFTRRFIINLFLITGVVLLLASVKTSFASEQPLVLSDANIPPEFTASYKIKKSGLNVGEMQLALEKEQADKWIYHSATKPIGLAAVFLSDQPVIDRTELQLAENIIRPVVFEHVQKLNKKIAVNMCSLIGLITLLLHNTKD